MRSELKSDIQRKVDRHTWRGLSYTLSISLIITCNIFFGIFVWHPYDKAPNFAMGFVSFLVILFIIYNWRADYNELKLEKAKFINKDN